MSPCPSLTCHRCARALCRHATPGRCWLALLSFSTLPTTPSDSALTGRLVTSEASREHQSSGTPTRLIDLRREKKELQRELHQFEADFTESRGEYHPPLFRYLLPKKNVVRAAVLTLGFQFGSLAAVSVPLPPSRVCPQAILRSPSATGRRERQRSGGIRSLRLLSMPPGWPERMSLFVLKLQVRRVRF